MGCCCGKCEETLEKKVNERFSEGQIIAKGIFWVNLRYQRSTGMCQIKGNGALVLTSVMLWFTLIYPNKQIEMPLRSIRVVAVGRNPHQALRAGLIVDFVDPTSGIEDQVIFELTGPQSWKRIIEETIQR